MLPPHVVDKVLGCLSLWHRLRLRAVCKLWNHIIVSQQQARFEPPCICVQSKDNMTLWCPDSGDTLHTRFKHFFHPKWSRMPMLKLLASSGGLLLGICQDPHRHERYALCVGNPLRSKWDKLPSFQQISYSYYQYFFDLESLSTTCASMVVDPLSGHYNIVLLATLRQVQEIFLYNPEPHAPLFYDSRTHSWQTHQTQVPSKNIDIPWLTGSATNSVHVYHIQWPQCNISVNLHAGGPIVSKNFMIGNYKGRSICIQGYFRPFRQYRVSELEWEAAHEEWRMRELSRSPSTLRPSHDYYQCGFMLEGDYVVAFSKGAAIAFNLDRLSWHGFQPPASEVTGGCIFKPVFKFDRW